MISKQECILMLLNRSMVDCSESIETVSISRASKVQLAKSKSPSNSIVAQYARRPSAFRTHSLHRYFHFLENEKKTPKKRIVPHYVGGVLEVSFPRKKGFASSMLQIYKPWVVKFEVKEENCIAFDDFLRSSNCPQHLTMAYIRSVRRYTNPESRVDQIGKKQSGDGEMDSETEDFLRLTGLHQPDDTSGDISFSYDYGLEYDWSVEVKSEVSTMWTILTYVVLTLRYKLQNGSTWLQNAISKQEEENISCCDNLQLPTKSDGSYYELDDLKPYKDQYESVMKFLLNLKQWMTSDSCIMRPQPLRTMIIGSGTL